MRQYNSALAMASVRADFVSRGTGVPKYNPTVTVHGRMYNETSAPEPGNGIIIRNASVYIHDTKHVNSSRNHFYSGIREDLLFQLALMFEEKNNYVHSFLSLRNLIQINGIRYDVKLVIHAHEKLCQDTLESTMYQKQAKWLL